MKKTSIILVCLSFITCSMYPVNLYRQERRNFAQRLTEIQAELPFLSKCLSFIHDYVRDHEKILESRDLFNIALEFDLLERAEILQQTTTALNATTKDVFCQRIILKREKKRIEDAIFQQQVVIAEPLPILKPHG